jgi:formylglycine-generating enzyme required for sulfatase activity
MISIPAGEFTMGSDKYSAERPVQKISLDSYYIDKHLVTNAMFAKFIEESKYKTDAEKEGAGNVGSAGAGRRSMAPAGKNGRNDPHRRQGKSSGQPGVL